MASAYGTLATTSRTGYTFNGWFTAASGGTQVTAATIVSTASNHTLYAQWTASTYTVTFDANGGNTPSPASKVVTYDFCLWHTGNHGSFGLHLQRLVHRSSGGTQVTAATIVTTASNHTLYAQWTANTYTVTFDANGGSAPSPASKQVTFGSAYGTLATTDRTGYTFSGWFTAASGGTQVTAATIVTTASNHTLYAQWSTLPNHTVTFKANGGIGSDYTQTTNASTSLILNTFTRTGYAFSHWNTASNDSGTTYTNGQVYDFSADMDLYAQWTANAYTVTFDANGGSAPTPTSKQVTFGSAYGTLATTSRTGYTFNGWFTAASGGTQVTAATVVTTASNHTLYAQWTANTYTVTFDANGGSAPSPASKQVTFGSAYGTLATTSRTGYTFNGWFTAASGGTQVTAATVVTTASNHTLYAQWTANTYTVTFDANGGNTPSPASKIVTYDSAYGTLATTSRTGYTFSGWFTAASGGTQVTAATVVTTASNHTLYAQWTAGAALQFDGTNDYVTFGIGNALAYPTYTIETWFKRTGAGVGVTTGTGGITSAIPLVTKGTSETESATVDINYFLGIDANTGVLIADFEEGAGGTNPSLNHPVSGSTIIANNIWYHAAMTYDGTTLKIYLNGTQEGSLTVGQPSASATTSPTAFGTSIRSNGTTVQGYFAGVLDEVRIWNYSRTQTEIRSTINTELTSGTGLAARWGMNEGSGTTVASSVGTFIGTLTNGPVWVTPGTPFNITFDTDAPAAPTGLTAIPGVDSASLSWIANSEPDLAGYNVYRSTTSPVTKTTPINSSLLSSPAYIDSTATHGPTYYYAVTAKDTSGNESDLSNEANATPTAPPEYATALQFDGSNDYVTFGNVAGLGVQNFTIETWFYWTGGGISTTTSGTQGLPSVIPLVSKGRGEADGSNVDMNYFLGIDTNTHALAADFEDMASGMNYPFVGTIPVTTNSWHHAAVTYDSVQAVFNLYLDGNLAGTYDIPGTNIVPRYDSIQHAGLATAMTSTGTPAGYFQGMLDEARIWNVVRSQMEIRSTINAELTSGTGLVARWGLNEGSGLIIGSSVGTFPGTLTNGPVWVTPGAPFNITFDTEATGCTDRPDGHRSKCQCHPGLER